MKKIQYTRITLEKFSLSDLHKICKYYDIEYYPSWNKKRLVEEILVYSPPEYIAKTYNYIYPISDIIPTEIKKSVRISRIEQANRKE